MAQHQYHTYSHTVIQCPLGLTRRFFSKWLLLIGELRLPSVHFNIFVDLELLVLLQSNAKMNTFLEHRAKNILKDSMTMPLTSCFLKMFLHENGSIFMKEQLSHLSQNKAYIWEYSSKTTKAYSLQGAGVVQKKDRSYLMQFLTTRSVDDVGYAGMCTRWLGLITYLWPCFSLFTLIFLVYLGVWVVWGGVQTNLVGSLNLAGFRTTKT